MSTYAVDTSSVRTDERLSAFLSEIGASEPVDNFFVRRPAFDALMKKKKTLDGGRQVIYPIDSGNNPTISDFSDYDVFDTSGMDTVLTVGYPMVNKGGVLQLSWEEQRELAGSDHQIFDRLSHIRKNTVNTIMDACATDMFAASAAAKKVTPLPVTVDATGATGGLNASTDADWASTETASGSFASQGLTDMNTLYNTLINNGSMPDLIFTTQSIYEFYEKEVDPDVRYANAMGIGGRGFKTLEFKQIPLIHDLKATSGVLYMLDSENLFYVVDSAGNFTIGPFVTPHNQEVSVAKIKLRYALVCNRRKSHGKLTGITA